jgi:excinuclease ABC subunit A
MSTITVRGARLHNLKNVTLSIPKNKLVVFTGVSGSGKSTMAFDTLHREGQRQYMESLGMVTYASKPAVDSISGLSPSISVEQSLANRSPRSTVGTATEVFTYLRVLFARVGHRPCPQCGGDVPPAHEGGVEGLRDKTPSLWDEEAPEVRSFWDQTSSLGDEVPVLREQLPGSDASAAPETGEEGGARAACPQCGARLPEMDMAMFSFNKPDGACPACTGLGVIYAPDLARLLDEEKSILDGGVAGWNPVLITYHAGTLRSAGRHYGFEFDPALPIGALGPAQRDLLLYGVASQQFRRHFPDVEPPATVAKGRFEGIVPTLLRRHAEHAGDPEYLENIERVLIRQTCPECGGARLRPEARAVTVAGRPLVAPYGASGAHAAQQEAGDCHSERADGIPLAAANHQRRISRRQVMSGGSTADSSSRQASSEASRIGTSLGAVEPLSHLPLAELAEWVDSLDRLLSPEERLIAEPIVTDLRERIRRLLDVGLGYLTLERAAPTLSAGEAQRLRLAALLGSGLTGVLYVLDEPTIGVHPRDTARLIAMLRALRDLHNTVLVIEHDLEVIAAADWVVDFGPGAGRDGGRIVAQGPPGQVAANPDSLTGRYLASHARTSAPQLLLSSAPPPGPDGPTLTIHGAREHNLQDITVRFPLRKAGSGHGMLVALTGVSGSGKSTLLFDILDRAARRRFCEARTAHGAAAEPGAHDAITGWEFVDSVITIDQTPLARSTRSNAATYTDAFTAIREAFAAQPAARAAGLTAAHFSFNVPGGRCERCEGAGVLAVEMHFLPDVLVRCPACRGRRYKPGVLAVQYRGCDIARVLDLTIEEALPLFSDVPAARDRLALLAETGLGYLQLGQPASTFSGGEAQRVKLARELASGRRGSGARRATGRTLYLLDEPTTGLHSADVERLLRLLQRLVDAGSTVLVIEHNLDVIRCADWVIDLGPEGGPAGGRIVAEGPPEAVADTPGSHTGAWLRKMFAAAEEV